MTYKEVFQLAQEKGYELNFVDAAKMSLYEPLELILDTKNIYLLELTLIQKWLRDEHNLSIIVEDHYSTCDWVVRVRPSWDMPSENGRLRRTYEEALLEGIAEALKIL